MPRDAARPVVNLLNSDLSEMSKNERLKLESQGLFWVAGKQKHSFRSEIEAMSAGEAETIGNEAKEISKHFGIYKQQERFLGRKSKRFIFMLRLKVPAGGEFSPEQWRAVDDAADRFANGTLRLTTRQGIQFHYVEGKKLGPLVRFLNEDYPSTGYEISTLGACGDVNRNTMCSAADDLDAELPMSSRELAFAIAAELAPRSSAYYQIFLTHDETETQTPMSVDEPIYGESYLPRKFKVGIAHPRDNSIDLLTQDVGLLPVPSGADVEQYDLYTGGGLGATHNNPRTAAHLGLYLGRVPREQVVDAVRSIVILQKENGERKDRKLARWKYTIRRMGVDTVKQALRERFGIDLTDAEPQPVPPNRFLHGWHPEAGDGDLCYLGLPVESGRIADRNEVKLRTAVRTVVAELGCGVRVTGNQDLLLTHIPAAKREWVDGVLAGHGVRPQAVSLFRRQAFGCPALPTCGLAMTEAENSLPAFASAVEAAGLGDVDVVLRIAGCPNSCSRPPSAEIGIIGYGKNAHQITVGGSREGTRLGRELYPKVSTEQMNDILVGLLRAIKYHNPEGLPAGEFLHRTPNETLIDLVGVEP